MSTEPKWTEGPWKTYKGAVHPVLENGSSGNDHHAICGEFYGPDALFNAALTAAAPDLYERLEASTKTLILERDCYYECCSLSDGTVPDDDDVAQLENLDAVIAANQAALARARGEA